MRFFPLLILIAGMALAEPEFATAQVSQADAEKAVRANATRFAEAFNRQDAKAVAAFWSENGSWSDPAADVRIKGRAALEESYQSYFSENPEARIKLDLTAVRVVSDELAIEEGRTIISLEGDDSSISAYTAIHRKIDDGWLMEHVVESEIPETATHPPGLEELAWLEGEWIDATDASTIHFENTWVAGGNYLRRMFTVMIADRVDMTGLEIVGWDPVDERIRSWVFDSEGGFGELRWRKGDEPGVWIKAASATFGDGEQATAVHVMKKLDDDNYTFKTVARQRDGHPLPNIDEVTITRKR